MGSAYHCDLDRDPTEFNRLTSCVPPFSIGLLGRTVLFFALLGGASACEREIGVIEALPRRAPTNEPPAPTASPPPTVPPTGGPTVPPAPTAPPALPDRGRVQVRDGNLVTDKGTRLRGVTFGVDAQPDVQFETDLFERMAREAGLNALHVYLENVSHETGAHVTQADALVESTSAAGLYLVLGIGGGPAPTTFDLEKVRSFWSLYAPRYAARTHVLYEIHNIPDPNCEVAYSAETLSMEQEIYEQIRSLAPNTHVALYSFQAVPSAAALLDDLEALEPVVDWSKASVAFQMHNCNDQDYLAELLEVTRARGIASFASELWYPTPYDTVARLESERVGWFSFEWLVFNRDLSAFRDGHDAASVTWCPDFGLWPEDSQTCRTP